jgi:uncharacterized protein (TIGR02996 family)
MSRPDSLLQAILAAPEDTSLRLVYADWLDDRGHPGASYLRAEVALAQASADEAGKCRRSLLELIPQLPSDWRNRFEQPDLILAPPVPFKMGWCSANAHVPKPYRSLANLDPVGFSPDLPWLSGEGVQELLIQEEHEQEELEALAEVQQRAKRLKLLLPPGFEAFAQDFPRRGAVSPARSYYEVCLHDATVGDFPQFGEGYLINFFGDMNYGDPHQLTWSLYLVPGIAWHCVVVNELAGDASSLTPDDPALIYYCAPSFQAFLYRWWLENQNIGGRRRRGSR